MGSSRAGDLPGCEVCRLKCPEGFVSASPVCRNGLFDDDACMEAPTRLTEDSGVSWNRPSVCTRDATLGACVRLESHERLPGTLHDALHRAVPAAAAE